MHIDVALVPAALQSMDVRDKTVVAVDVLRATSTLVAAFEKGVRQVTPVETVEDAMKLKQLYPESLLLGEVYSVKPEGFDFENSPTELLGTADLDGKHLIMRSTNGTRLIKQLGAQGADSVFIGSFVNLASLIAVVEQQGMDVVICCAGNSGTASLEDIGFAGALAQYLSNEDAGAQLSDAAKTAIAVWKSHQENAMALFHQSFHASTLQHLGRDVDLHCVAEWTSSHVPVFTASTGQITSYPVPEASYV